MKALHSHTEPIVHGDVNPESVFVDAQTDRDSSSSGGGLRTAKLALLNSMRLKRAALAVARAYDSPQLLKGKSARPSDDIYAFGVTIAELFSGLDSKPFADRKPAEIKAL